MENSKLIIAQVITDGFLRFLKRRSSPTRKKRFFPEGLWPLFAWDRRSSTTMQSVCNKAALSAIRRVVEALKGDPSHEADIIIEAEDMEMALAEVTSV